MRTSLRTTTAMLAALSLVLPTTLPAQQGTTAEALQECAENATDCDPAALVEGLAQELTGTAEQPGDEAEAAAQAATQVQAEQETAAQADATAEEQAAAQAKAAEEAEAQAAAAEEAAAQAAAAQAKAAEEAEAQAAAAAQAEAEAAAAARAEVDATAQAEAAAAEKAVAEAEAQAEAAAQSETDQELRNAEATPQEQDAAETAQDEASRAEREAEKAALQARLQAEQAAAQSAAALAATEGGQTEGNLVEETVTEETARRSDQDFTGEIQAEAGAQPPAAAKSGGLSKLEKALLVGAGALAVGALIRGNREVVSTSPDRVVVSSSDGNFQVLKDDDALLRQPGNQVQTRTFDDGSTRSVVTRENGSQVVTIQDPEMRVVRRVLIRNDGSEVVLIDDTVTAEPVDVTALPEPSPRATAGNDDALRRALEREGAFSRRFSLSQVRQIDQVRKLAPSIEVASIQFETGSAAINPDEAQKLADLGLTISRAIEENPNEIFLVEGHTDAVGSSATNLILSDRRAESLALALTEYFGVPPENLVVQGYGESDLKVETDSSEPANRRAELRRITNLLQVASIN